ncbi:T9SS type A sorting domain-containing protein [Catalinimonas alkaloidigena]|uniref:T9SS type A sorting domain-containing protein n=1 Tax=Catalinimonas alkaloidigena TaxID=1075417 RepID=UPI0015A25FE6|nr:T9SS type A sorting domain-containing protein [Catalinimonas alkaloidigena]
MAGSLLAARGINGPATTCPGTPSTYAYDDDNPDCSYVEWQVKENGNAKSYTVNPDGTITVNWSTGFTSGEVKARGKYANLVYNSGCACYLYEGCAALTGWSTRSVALGSATPFFTAPVYVFCTSDRVLSVTVSACAQTRFLWAVPSGWEIETSPGVWQSRTTSNPFEKTGLNTSTVNVRAPSTGQGAATLSVKAKTTSGTYPTAWTTRTVQLGTPASAQLNMYRGDAGSNWYYLCPGSSYFILVSGPPGTWWDNWSFMGNFSSATGYNGSAGITTASTFNGGSINVQSFNRCGTGASIGRTLISCCNCTSGYAARHATDAADSLHAATMHAAYETLARRETLRTDAEGKVSLYPNPALTDEVVLEWDASLGVTAIEVITLQGEVLTTLVPATPTRTTFSSSSLPVGQYVLHLKTASGSVQKRLLKL